MISVTKTVRIPVDLLVIDIPVTVYEDGDFGEVGDVLNANPGGSRRQRGTNPRVTGLACVDAMPDDFPGRVGDRWRGVVDLTTSPPKLVILDGVTPAEPARMPWPGPACSLWFTVKDAGSYSLFAKGELIAQRHEDYVPNDLIPGEHGDVLHLLVAADGTIVNWSPVANATDFGGSR